MDLRTKREIYLERRYAEACKVISDIVVEYLECIQVGSDLTKCESFKRELIKAELFLNK